MLPLSTHSAVEMLHDSALYKFMIDIDIITNNIYYYGGAITKLYAEGPSYNVKVTQSQISLHYTTASTLVRTLTSVDSSDVSPCP